MAYETILLEHHNSILLVKLNRPESLNAINKKMLSELCSVLRAADKDRKVRVVVIMGTEKFFAAGADIKEMEKKDSVDMILEDFFTEEHNIISSFRKPLIAAVSGYALGGGCELAMMCDIILASDTAKFGQPEINVGAIPGAGGSQRMPRFIGKSKAMYAILTGDMIDAYEAEKCGLVAKVFKNEEFEENIIKIANKIASKSSALARLAKECVNLSFETPLQEGLRAERAVFMSTFALEDHVEGMTAFSEKRKPNWKNK